MTTSFHDPFSSPIPNFTLGGAPVGIGSLMADAFRDEYKMEPNKCQLDILAEAVEAIQSIGRPRGLPRDPPVLKKGVGQTTALLYAAMYVANFSPGFLKAVYVDGKEPTQGCAFPLFKMGLSGECVEIVNTVDDVPIDFYRHIVVLEDCTEGGPRIYTVAPPGFCIF